MVACMRLYIYIYMYVCCFHLLLLMLLLHLIEMFKAHVMVFVLLEARGAPFEECFHCHVLPCFSLSFTETFGKSDDKLGCPRKLAKGC